MNDNNLEWKEWEELGNHYYLIGKHREGNECYTIAEKIRGMTDSDRAMIIAKLWEAKKDEKLNA